MATFGAGVWRYDGEKVTRYAVKDGAKEITLFSISKDNSGDLWLGTHQAGPYKFHGNVFEKMPPCSPAFLDLANQFGCDLIRSSTALPGGLPQMVSLMPLVNRLVWTV